MSLISDALKRTQQNAAPRPPHPPILRKPMAASRSSSAPAETSRNLLLIVLLGVVFVGGIGLFGLWRLYSMMAERAKAVSQVSSIATPPPPEPKPAPKEPEPAVLPPPVIPEPVKEIVRSTQAEAPKPKPKPIVSEAPPPTPPPLPPPRELPKLVLQGVTIHGGLREALINGQIVGVGDEVEGAKVVSIEPAKVKLKFDGREITLTFSR
jgi:hypothetical protein